MLNNIKINANIRSRTLETLAYEKWQDGRLFGLFPEPAPESVIEKTVNARGERMLWVGPRTYFVSLRPQGEEETD